MVVTDPIADMIIRIKNGSRAKKKVVEVRWSKIKEKIGEILVKEGYLKTVKVETAETKFKVLKMELIYHAQEPALTDVKRILKTYIDEEELIKKAKETIKEGDKYEKCENILQNGCVCGGRIIKIGGCEQCIDCGHSKKCG